MRVQLSDTALETLQSASPSVGLLLGQISSKCYNIIYLARTPEDKNEAGPSEDEKDEQNVSGSNRKSIGINDVQEVSIAEHAKYVTRMLPGGMFVLGIFVASSEDIFNDKTQSSKIKAILSYINKTLSSNKYMFGVPLNNNERVILHYSKDRVVCKTLDISNSLQMKNIDVNIKCDLKNWQQLDCYHEFDEVFPVIMKKSSMSVREQFQQILERVHQSLELSLVFLDGKLKNSTDSIESINNRKKSKSAKLNDETSVTPIQVATLLPCESDLPDTVEYLECDGTTHFSGVVASRVYLNPVATIEDATNAVKQDIVRSLASRFTMHCDALISDNLLPEEKICFNEPPRRVLIRIPGLNDGNIFFSDYLFPGESPGEALSSVKEMLDVDITEEDVISNIETPADTSEFDAIEKNPTSETSLTAPQDANKLIVMSALGFGIVIAVIAVIMQFYFR